MSRYRMVRPEDRVLVGVSGGADSVALLEMLVELAPRLSISLAVAHLNHGLREEASEDEKFCRELGAGHGLPFVSEHIDVRALAKRSKRSVEDEARRARYRFLDEQAGRLGCDRIAVGHTLDDQAETFLLRLFRGSGGKGLASVHPVVGGRRIRPLLGVRRREIASFLEERGIPFREDATNAELRFTRNRIRHRTLPHLVSDFNPRIVETLARTAEVLREEEDWMDGETRRIFAELAVESTGRTGLDASRLLLLHPALRRRLVRLAIERLRGLEGVSHRHVEDVLSLLGPGRSGREIHLPGLVAERAFGEVRIRPGSARTRQNVQQHGYNGFEYRLTIPARVRIPEGSGTISARLSSERPGPSRLDSPAFGNAVIVGIEGQRREVPELPVLVVRSPRPGDRFQPLGAPGSKSLTRYFMERKISRQERQLHPVVVKPRCAAELGSAAGGDEILWVVGHGVSQASRNAKDMEWVSLEWIAS